MTVPHCANFDVIIDCLKARAPATYLEVGCNEGHSLYAAFNGGYVSAATVVDTWGNRYGGTGRGSPEHVKALLGDMAEKVTFHTGQSSAILPMLTGPFDVILVDADHSAAGCWSDMRDCLPLLAKDGAMIVDDINHPQHTYLRRTATEFAAENGLRIEFIAAHCGVAILTFP